MKNEVISYQRYEIIKMIEENTCTCTCRNCFIKTTNFIFNTFCCWCMICGCGWGGPCTCNDCNFHAM